MNKIGNYVVFWYDFDDEGNIIIVDELERETFDEALDVVKFSWGLPFEICKVLENPFYKKAGVYKTVARSLQYAQL